MISHGMQASKSITKDDFKYLQKMVYTMKSFMNPYLL